MLDSASLCPTALSSPHITASVDSGFFNRLPIISFITSFHNKTRTIHSSKAAVLQARYPKLLPNPSPKGSKPPGHTYANQVVQLMSITIKVLLTGKERLAASMLMDPRRGARHFTSVSPAVIVSIPGFLLLPILFFFR